MAVSDDHIFHLASGTELSVEAAVGDLTRARRYIAESDDIASEFNSDGLISDIDHVVELIHVLADFCHVPSREATLADNVFELADRAVNPAGYADEQDESERRAVKRDRIYTKIYNILHADGCTGDMTDRGLQHDGDTCPIHEAGSDLSWAIAHATSAHWNLVLANKEGLSQERRDIYNLAAREHLASALKLMRGESDVG